MSAARTYKGLVRGNRVELADAPRLPEGTEVEVIVPDRAAASSPRGSPAAILDALKRQPHATAKDVEALLSEIRASRQPASIRGPFDEGVRP